MKVQDLLAQCLVVITRMILIAGISSCVNISESSEVHTTYLANSYFSKHGHLVDSKFDEFITRDILSATCGSHQDNVNLAPRLSDLQRKLIGEGSHRRLSSSLKLKISLESDSKTPEDCEAIIVERLPSGVFADPFELQHLLQQGVFADAAVFGDTNLELPSFRSNRSLVEVHVEIASSSLSRLMDEVEINAELPLHVRYQPLGHGFSRVEFGPPDLFLRCRFDEKQQNKSCLFQLTNQSTKSNDADLVWEVPCGNKEHTEVVFVVTFISAIVSTLLIIVASIWYSGNRASDDLKQS